MKTSAKITFSLFILILLAACGIEPYNATLKEAPNAANSPALFGVQTKPLNQISMQADLTKTPWSGNYWATYQGGLAHRWQNSPGGRDYQNYMYSPLSTYEIESMNNSALNLLSPAEKYDLYLGKTDFPLTKKDQQNTRNSVNTEGQVPTWFGICHGWAPASIYEPEPGPSTTVTTPSGQEITFYSSDIKALLSKHYADAKVPTYFIGGRCNNKDVQRDENGRVVNIECRDTNPATFHLVLDEFIANKNESFVADVTFDAEVWNQPVSGYTFRYSNHRPLNSNYLHAAYGTAELVDVDLELRYVVETYPNRNQVKPYVKTKKMKYTLELDSNGYIIGGEWISEARPDFLWSLRRKPTLAQDGGLNYEKIKYLLDRSLSLNPTEPTPTEPTPPENPEENLYKLTLSPEMATIKTDETFKFTAKALDYEGNSLPLSLKWSVQGYAATIDQTGLFTAPSYPGSFQVQVEYYNETLSQNFKQMATVTVIEKDIPVDPDYPSDPDHQWEEPSLGTVSFINQGDTLTLNPGQRIRLRAIYRDAEGREVHTRMYYDADAGRIDRRGNFTAPRREGTYVVSVNPIIDGEILWNIQDEIEIRVLREEEPVIESALRGVRWTVNNQGRRTRVNVKGRAIGSEVASVRLRARTQYGESTILAEQEIYHEGTFRLRSRVGNNVNRVVLELVNTQGRVVDRQIKHLNQNSRPERPHRPRNPRRPGRARYR